MASDLLSAARLLAEQVEALGPATGIDLPPPMLAAARRVNQALKVVGYPEFGSHFQARLQAGDYDVPAHLRDKRLPEPVGFLAEAFARLLQDAEGENWQRDGLVETPARAARAWAERTAGYSIDPASVFKVFDGEGYDEMVALAPIPFHSTCEHHMEDFDGVAAVVYIADGKIVGLSKMARLVDVFALRLQNQERITQQVADAMVEHLQPKGVLVRLEGRHLCCERRGVRKTGMVARTNVVRGLIKDDPKARAEAMELIRDR